MNDPRSSEKMRQIIRAETERQRQTAAHTPSEYAGLLGAFLRACLSNLGRSPADFAKALDIEQELGDAILEGLLPVSEIDDEFLAEIARAVGHEPATLRAIVARPIVVTRSGDSQAQQPEGARKQSGRGQADR
jgi:hypothetical protein